MTLDVVVGRHKAINIKLFVVFVRHKDVSMKFVAGH